MVDTARPVADAHGCGYPDEACRTCEAAATPPCCHTPQLCGGPHPDCINLADSNVFEVERGPDGKAIKLTPLYSGPHGDYTIHPADGRCFQCQPPDFLGDRRPDQPDRTPAPATDDDVAHQRDGRSCRCPDGCCPDGW